MKIGQVYRVYPGGRDVNVALEISAKEYLTKSVQILAKKRTGKSYTASKIAEELLKETEITGEPLPICIVTPLPVYWGLKQKWPIVIFGDEDNKHADYPLVDDKDKIVDQAELLADFISTDPTSIIIDLSGWVESKQQRFMAEFAKRFFAKNKIARHVFIEEADVFIPQSVNYPDEIDSRHYVDNLVRRGGMKGIGTTIISQRPAVVSKNVLSQSDLSIFLHLKDKNDLDPARHEINNDEEISKDEQLDIIKRIKSAQPGEAFFYSSAWLKLRAFVKVDKKETYHAGATRGQPDFMEDEDVKLVPVSIADVETKLHDIATITASEDNKPSKLSTGPALPSKEKVDRLLADAKKELRAEVDRLTKERDMFKHEHEVEFARAERLLAERHETDALKTLLRQFLRLDELVVPGGNGQGQIATETMDLTVKVERKDVSLDESSYLGRIGRLIAEGYFKEQGRSRADVTNEIMRRYNIAKGGKVYAAVQDALDELVTVKYGYLRKDGDVYVGTERTIKVQEVPVLG